MSSKTKIVVLHMKEVVYTAVFLALAIFMLILVFTMFHKKDPDDAGAASDTAGTAVYVPGVYTSSIQLNENSFDVQVTVDADHINSIELVNLSETATVMYPLMEPTLDEIAQQIYTQSTENITYSDENKYTSMLLLDAIEDALGKARAEE